MERSCSLRNPILIMVRFLLLSLYLKLRSLRHLMLMNDYDDDGFRVYQEESV